MFFASRAGSGLAAVSRVTVTEYQGNAILKLGRPGPKLSGKELGVRVFGMAVVGTAFNNDAKGTG